MNAIASSWFVLAGFRNYCQPFSTFLLPSHSTATVSTTHAISPPYCPPPLDEVRRSAPGAADPEKRDIDDEDEAGDMFANGLPC